MAKLYPPYIEGKIPAQSGAVLNIPFRLNRNVSLNQIKCIIARIKTVSTNHWLGTVPIIDEEKRLEIQRGGYLNYSASNSTEFVAHINLSEVGLNLIVGQFYKIQLAFYHADSNTTGYFSSVGIFKYTTQPILTMPGLSRYSTSSNIYTYTGLYSQAQGDITEKIYSYEFILRNTTTGEIIERSGVQTHDSSADEKAYESIDVYTIEADLNHVNKYTIEYAVTTMNGLTGSSGQMHITGADVLDNPLEKCKLIATNDYENGRMLISIQDVPKDFIKNSRLGYVIARSSNSTNYSIWQDVIKFTVSSMEIFPTDLSVDYTIEQGVKYKYSLQLYQSSGLRTQRLVSNEIMADFEDIFLYDGNRQLKIRYNPKVSSFKTTTLETKVDTLGGKYPFVFRNGNVAYKEFPLSGLVSYLMDKDEQFMSNAELGFTEQNIARDGHSGGQYTKVNTRGTSPTGENFFAERAFKLRILDWLNNGQTKLFRSPAEGNYIIRMINVSLTPNDQLGRMLHTFNSTAYEIADYNYANLIKYGFLKDKEETSNRLLLYLSKPIKELKTSGLKSQVFQFGNGARKLEIKNAKPGTIFAIKYNIDMSETNIMIGSTGTYTAPMFENSIDYIRLVDDPFDTAGYIEYGVYSDMLVEDFTEIRNVLYHDEGIQTTGRQTWNDMFGSLVNVKYGISYIYHLHLATREKAVVRQIGNQIYYFDGEDVALTSLNPNLIYQIEGNTNYYIDGKTGQKIYGEPNYQYKIKYKDKKEQTFDLSTIGEITVRGLDEVESITVGNGLIADCYFQLREYVYGIEEDTPELYELKSTWLNLVEQRSELLSQPEVESDLVYKLDDLINTAYYAFIDKLEETLNA